VGRAPGGALAAPEVDRQLELRRHRQCGGLDRAGQQLGALERDEPIVGDPENLVRSASMRPLASTATDTMGRSSESVSSLWV